MLDKAQTEPALLCHNFFSKKNCRIPSGTQKPIPEVGNYPQLPNYKRVVMFRWVVGRYRLYKRVVMFRWVVGKYRLHKRL